jgi:hypothetical protein
MDEIVRLALKKWPNVPDCFGWLALDSRGRWRIGAERQTLTHGPTLAFIGRNYLSDEAGRWLFQNGPQRVYVELEYTPWVWRLGSTGGRWELKDHTGREACVPSEVFIDEDGRLLLACGSVVGVLHDHDSTLLMEGLRGPNGERPEDDLLAGAIEGYVQGLGGHLVLEWPGVATVLSVSSIERARVAGRFGFDPHPAMAGPST